MCAAPILHEMAAKKQASRTRPEPRRVRSGKTSVDDSIAKLDVPWRAEVAALRTAILSSNRSITEQLKWNAPSFCFEGDDRVTFRFPPRGGVQLVFHRGVKVKDARGFAFTDESGLIRWAAPDRGVITFSDPHEMQTVTTLVVKVVNAWMKATA